MKHFKGLIILVFSLVILIPAVLSAESSLRHPYRAKIWGLENLLDLEPGDSARVQMRGIDGLYRFKFRRVKSPNPEVTVNNAASFDLSDRPDLKLYQGYIQAKSNRQSELEGASIDIYRGRIQLTFHGNRQRMFVATVFRRDLVGGEGVSARLQHAPATMKLPCGVKSQSLSGESAGEIAAEFAEAAPVLSPNREVQLGTDADMEYFQNNGSSVADTNAKIVSVVNAVDAIYLSQLGLDITIVAQNVFTDNSQPYTSTDAETLLNQFRSHTEINSQISGDVRHLWTGKTTTVDGDPAVIGVAFTGVVCLAPSFSYGYSEDVAASIETLVTAHEIGHNFNASHNCSGIMAPTASPSNTSFSQCSINEIENFVNSNNSCLAEIDDGTTVGTSVLRFSAKLNRRNRFRGTFTPQDDTLNGCTVNLFGAPGASSLTGDFSGATLIATGTLTTTGVRTRFNGRRIRQTPNRNVKLAGQVVCDGLDNRASVVRTIRKESGGEGLSVVKGRRFLRHLAKRVS